MSLLKYKFRVQNIQYDAHITRTQPNIGHVVRSVIRFQSNPKKAHWQAVFEVNDLEIVGYIDVDFATDR